MTAPTLAEEILAVLPDLMAAHPDGPALADVAARLSATWADVRRMAGRLDAEERAILVRRKGSRTLYLVPTDYPILACRHCHVAFERPKKSKRRCCSRSCAIAWSWTRPGAAEKRRAGLRAERSTPEARERQSHRSRQRWDRPGERAKQAERNRRRWADPETRDAMSAALRQAQGTPERRAKYSAIRREAWADPAFREKTVAGIRRSKAKAKAKRREI